MVTVKGCFIPGTVTDTSLFFIACTTNYLRDDHEGHERFHGRLSVQVRGGDAAEVVVVVVVVLVILEVAIVEVVVVVIVVEVVEGVDGVVAGEVLSSVMC